VAAGVFGVLTHLAVHNLFDNLWVHDMYIHVAILLGLLAQVANFPPASAAKWGGLRGEKVAPL